MGRSTRRKGQAAEAAGLRLSFYEIISAAKNAATLDASTILPLKANRDPLFEDEDDASEYTFAYDTPPCAGSGSVLNER